MEIEVRDVRSKAPKVHSARLTTGAVKAEPDHGNTSIRCRAQGRIPRIR